MATAAMVLLIFYSGLHFKGASIANQVAWLGLRPGIRFGNRLYGAHPRCDGEPGGRSGTALH